MRRMLHRKDLLVVYYTLRGVDGVCEERERVEYNNVPRSSLHFVASLLQLSVDKRVLTDCLYVILCVRLLSLIYVVCVGNE